MTVGVILRDFRKKLERLPNHVFLRDIFGVRHIKGIPETILDARVLFLSAQLSLRFMIGQKLVIVVRARENHLCHAHTELESYKSDLLGYIRLIQKTPLATFISVNYLITGWFRVDLT